MSHGGQTLGFIRQPKEEPSDTLMPDVDALQINVPGHTRCFAHIRRQERMVQPTSQDDNHAVPQDNSRLLGHKLNPQEKIHKSLLIVYYCNTSFVCKNV